jgi:hypothetical protein
MVPPDKPVPAMMLVTVPPPPPETVIGSHVDVEPFHPRTCPEVGAVAATLRPRSATTVVDAAPAVVVTSPLRAGKLLADKSPETSAAGTVAEAVNAPVPFPLTYPVSVEAPVPPFATVSVVMVGSAPMLAGVIVWFDAAEIRPFASTVKIGTAVAEPYELAVTPVFESVATTEPLPDAVTSPVKAVMPTSVDGAHCVPSNLRI